MTETTDDRLLATFAAVLGETEGLQLKSASEALAASVHAIVLDSGFKLVGVNGDKIPESARANPRALPPSWNLFTSHRSPISFDYTLQPLKDEAGREFSLQITLLGTSKALVSGLTRPASSPDEERTAVMETTLSDFFAPDVFPLRYSHTEIESQSSQIKAVFSAGDSLSKLKDRFKTDILDPLFPSLAEPTDSQDQMWGPPRGGPRDPTSSSQPLPHSGIPDIPEAPSSVVPFPGGEPLPGFEDEFELQQPGRAGFAPPPLGGTAPSLGSRDLYPPGLGPNDPFPLSGGAPYRGGQSGGGMHPTFDDPLFQGQPGVSGPPGSVPPGARYDPVLPFGSPQDERMGGIPRGGRNRGFPRGGPGFGGGFGGGFPGGFGGGGFR